jgi:hypothetical protein
MNEDMDMGKRIDIIVRWYLLIEAVGGQPWHFSGFDCTISGGFPLVKELI